MDCSGFTRFVYDTLGIDVEGTGGFDGRAR
jgi:cell wall-associated NlpC family hydrolase